LSWGAFLVLLMERGGQTQGTPLGSSNGNEIVFNFRREKATKFGIHRRLGSRCVEL
jgi:hypothetical protein